MSRNWIFTLNNPNDAFDATKLTNCTYCIYQLEQGEQGTQHYQGYLEFSEKKTLQSIRRIIPGIHLEPRRGTQQQAIEYCSKEATRLIGPFEWGTKKMQGERNDLSAAREAIIAGMSERDLADNFFGSWVRYNRSFKTYRNLIQPNRDWKPEIFLCYGPPGTGKSKYAKESCETSLQYWKQRSIWWDLYDAHPTVVLDDYYGWLPWDTLLRLLDRYPLLVETKGGQVNFLARKIYITTNQKPDQWYKESPNFKALTRRIEHFIYFPKENEKIDFPNWDLFNKATE